MSAAVSAEHCQIATATTDRHFFSASCTGPILQAPFQPLAFTAGSSPVGGSFAPGEFFFYQAADGQWLFLHPMNVRMLLAHAGGYANCPPQVWERACGICIALEQFAAA